MAAVYENASGWMPRPSISSRSISAPRHCCADAIALMAELYEMRSGLTPSTASMSRRSSSARRHCPPEAKA